MSIQRAAAGAIAPRPGRAYNLYKLNRAHSIVCAMREAKMAGLGTPELLILLAIVLLVFGVGRIGKLGSELGKGIRAFREGIREGQDELDEKDEKPTE